MAQEIVRDFVVAWTKSRAPRYHQQSASFPGRFLSPVQVKGVVAAAPQRRAVVPWELAGGTARLKRVAADAAHVAIRDVPLPRRNEAGCCSQGAAAAVCGESDGDDSQAKLACESGYQCSSTQQPIVPVPVCQTAGSPIKRARIRGGDGDTPLIFTRIAGPDAASPIRVESAVPPVARDDACISASPSRWSMTRRL